MTASASIARIRPGFSGKAFVSSLFLSACVYGGMAAFIWTNQDALKAGQQEKMASKTVVIERAAMPAENGVMGPSLPEAGIPDTAEEEHGEASEDKVSEAIEVPEVQVQAPEPAHEQAPPSGKAPAFEGGLAAAPAEGLYEETASGRLPVVRRKDNLTPFNAYRKPFSLPDTDTPMVAIGIADVGLSDVASEAAVSTMPEEISVILSPYSSTIDFWANEARNRGHEIWMTLPLESETYPATDPGPDTLLIGAPERENQEKLMNVMGRAVGYAGFVAIPKAAFMKEANDLRPVIASIYNRGLGFIDSSPDPAAVPQSMAIGMNAPYGFVDSWVDRTPAREAITAELESLEKTAKERGYAIGIIRPYPVSYQQVQDWAKQLESKGIALVPLSALTPQPNAGKPVNTIEAPSSAEPAAEHSTAAPPSDDSSSGHSGHSAGHAPAAAH